MILTQSNLFENEMLYKLLLTILESNKSFPLDWLETSGSFGMEYELRCPSPASPMLTTEVAHNAPPTSPGIDQGQCLRDESDSYTIKSVRE